MLNRRGSSSGWLDIVTKPLKFFTALSALVFIEGSFLTSQIFIHWALDRIAYVADPSGIDELSLLASQCILAASGLLMLWRFQLTHLREVIEWIAPAAAQDSNAGLELTRPINARDDLASNVAVGTSNTRMRLEIPTPESAFDSAQRQLTAATREPKFFKPYRPWIGGKGLSRSKR